MGRMNPCEEEIKSINSEIWHACAGSLVTLPPVGTVVVYFPQGHIEQFHEEDLLASHHALKSAKPQREFFCKTLTASDTITHGSLSLPRRATEKILPPLDYTMPPPIAQELVARDLHDKEWTFCHIFRAKSHRHFLMKGWSSFLHEKRLHAGDSLLFIRDVKQQLLLGIRRVNQQPTNISSSVLSSDCMQIESLMAAVHAAAANHSPFTVCYYPRTSPSEFVIPLAKYYNAVHNTQISSSIQFRMKFETEESEKPRYMSIKIVGKSDLDPVQWKDSKWRNLQVVCNEEGVSPKKVSMWEIEPVEAPSSLRPQPHPKKLRIADDLQRNVGENLPEAQIGGSDVLPLEISESREFQMDALFENVLEIPLHISPIPDVPSEMRNISRDFSGIGEEALDKDFTRAGPTASFNSHEVLDVALPNEVKVGNYSIKYEFSLILQAIFNRYGDICAECHMKSAFNRSNILENICRVIASMQQKTLNTLTRDDLSEWKVAVEDAYQVGVMVPWLMVRIEELSSAREVHQRLYGVKEEWTENFSFLNAIREAKGVSMSKLVEAQEKLEAAKVKVASLEEEVATLVSRSQDLEEQKRDIMERYDPVCQEAEVFKHFVNGDLAQGLVSFS